MHSDLKKRRLLGETIAELEENLKDAYLAMAMGDVPAEYKMKEVAV